MEGDSIIRSKGEYPGSVEAQDRRGSKWPRECERLALRQVRNELLVGARLRAGQRFAHFQRETTAKSSECREGEQLLQARFHPRWLRLHLPPLTTTRNCRDDVSPPLPCL
jgi:hypothetical protein